MAPWGDPGVTEQLQLTETAIPLPATAGGQATRTMQRAGLLRKLRFYNTSQLTVAGFAAAPSKSVYGPLAAISRITVEANGQIPLVNLSGYGAAIYNEVQNRDGSVLSRPLNIAELNVGDSLKLAQYDAIAANGTVAAKYPFEFHFAIPVTLRGQVSELGLWLLQNQAIDVGINVTFNPVYQAVATQEAVWSGGTIPGSAADTAASKLEIERELYNIPNDPKDFPNLAWAHQVIEYTNTWTGSFSRFSLPRSGLLLRAVVINLDANGLPVEYTDVSSLAWIYGANETPVTRKGQWLTQEYLQDYNRQPPKGVQVLDFYKWGWEGLKLVKDTEILANLRLETTFAATTTGTQRIILDRLYPVMNAR
jgi:hypothetical protein